MSLSDEAAHDPFVVKPPDAEVLAMEASMRRKHRRLGVIILVLSGLGVAATATTSMWAVGVVVAFPGVLWGVMRIANSLDRDHD